MRVRVVGLGVAVDDAVVDGLVNKRMLVIKSYDLFNPKTGVTDVVRVGRTNEGSGRGGSRQSTGTTKRASSRNLCLAITLQL